MSSTKELKQLLTKLIPMMRAACSAPELDTAQLDTARRAFLKVLDGEIPIERVEEIAMLACKQTHGEYKRVPAAGDLLYLYNTIAFEESRRELLLRKHKCSACGGEKTIVVYSPELETDIKVPCPFHKQEQS